MCKSQARQHHKPYPLLNNYIKIVFIDISKIFTLNASLACYTFTVRGNHIENIVKICYVSKLT